MYLPQISIYCIANMLWGDDGVEFTLKLSEHLNTCFFIIDYYIFICLISCIKRSFSHIRVRLHYNTSSLHKYYENYWGIKLMLTCWKALLDIESFLSSLCCVMSWWIWLALPPVSQTNPSPLSVDHCDWLICVLVEDDQDVIGQRDCPPSRGQPCLPRHGQPIRTAAAG